VYYIKYSSQGPGPEIAWSIELSNSEFKQMAKGARLLSFLFSGESFSGKSFWELFSEVSTAQDL
jgi:hypothetical protein